jgi:methyl coenzyme M reductase subunit C
MYILLSLYTIHLYAYDLKKLEKHTLDIIDLCNIKDFIFFKFASET